MRDVVDELSEPRIMEDLVEYKGSKGNPLKVVAAFLCKCSLSILRFAELFLTSNSIKIILEDETVEG